jgi:hypothetical protein
MRMSRGIMVAGVAIGVASAVALRGHEAAAATQRAATMPTQPGQSAFAAISEIVRILDSDSTTDWSKVDLEALRLHLVDMDLVVTGARVSQRSVPGGFEARVTGDGPVASAITRMVTNQTRMLDMMGSYRASTAAIPSGMRVTVTARDAGNARAVARLRGLGFTGVLTEGDHHVMHHLAVARGEKDAHSHRD